MDRRTDGLVGRRVSGWMTGWMDMKAFSFGSMVVHMPFSSRSLGALSAKGLGLIHCYILTCSMDPGLAAQ